MKKYIFSFLITSLLCLSLPALAQTNASTTEELMGQIEILKAKIAELQNQLSITQEELTAIKIELNFTRALVKGTTGDDVKNLQEFLKQYPDIYPEGLVTGYFGELTEKAVKKFQEKNDIEPIGIVGPKTRSILNELLTSGAGGSGAVPPGLLTAPGIQKKFETSSTLTQQTPSSTPSGTIPATPAVPSGGGGGGATPAVPAVPAQPHDTTAPTISNISATTTETTATITWTTSELADTKVYLSTISPVPATTTATSTDLNMVTSHSITLSGLNPSLIYYYLVVSKDSSGNTATSSQQSFTTLTPPLPPLSITDIKAYDISSDRAYIKWQTNLATNSIVEYGTAPLGTITPTRKTVEESTTNHIVKLENLTKKTSYYYRIVSGATISEEKTLTTYDTMAYNYEIFATSAVSKAYSIVFNKNDQYLYIADTDKNLMKYDLNGNKIADLQPVIDSGGLGYNPTKNVLYNIQAFTDSPQLIEEKDTNTGSTLKTIPAPDFKANGITFDYDEKVIYVVNPNNYDISKIDENGNKITVTDLSANGLKAMVGVAFNEIDGNFIIYDFHSGLITVMRKDFSTVESFDVRVLGSGFNYWTIRDVAFNSFNKHIYLADYETGVILDLAPKQ